MSGMLLFRGQQSEITLSESGATHRPTLCSWSVVLGALITGAGWMTTVWHGHSDDTVASLPLVLFRGLQLLNVDDLRIVSWAILLVR